MKIRPDSLVFYHLPSLALSSGRKNKDDTSEPLVEAKTANTENVHSV